MSKHTRFSQGDKIAIACDHGGYDLKGTVIDTLKEYQFKIIDLGTNSTLSVDYPDYAMLMSHCIRDKEASGGVIICGTGIGISIAANRYSFIRAALVHNEFTAEMARLHNNANVIALGARVINIQTAINCINKFFSTQFEGGRHIKRVEKLGNLNIHS